MSKREAPVHIISMAQHARPKVKGHGEFFRAQLNSQSSDVVTTPGSNRPSSKLMCWLLSVSSAPPPQAAPLAQNRDLVHQASNICRSPLTPGQILAGVTDLSRWLHGTPQAGLQSPQRLRHLMPKDEILLHALLHIGKAMRQDCGNFTGPFGPRTGRLAPAQQIPDPGQRNVQVAQVSNELDAVAGFRAVEMEASARPLRRLDQAEALIIPDGSEGDTRPPGHFPDLEKILRPHLIRCDSHLWQNVPRRDVTVKVK
jgi:hypothetical protein